MAFSFDTFLSTPKDQVRLRLSDTDSSAPVFQDETISAMLAMYSYDEACAQLSEAAGATFARMADSTAQADVKFTYTQRSKYFLELAKSIRSTAQPAAGQPVFPGATVGQMVNPDLRNYRTD